MFIYYLITFTDQMQLFIDPDPCLSQPCDINARCEREGLLSGSFMCMCEPPYLAGDGFNCSSMYAVVV